MIFHISNSNIHLLAKSATFDGGITSVIKFAANTKMGLPLLAKNYNVVLQAELIITHISGLLNG